MQCDSNKLLIIIFVNPRPFCLKVEISPYVYSASELFHPALFFLYLWFSSLDNEFGWMRVNEEV